jgi:hypothetical protein
MPRQHVVNGGVVVGVGGDVERERLCGQRAREVGGQAEVMPLAKVAFAVVDGQAETMQREVAARPPRCWAWAK